MQSLLTHLDNRNLDKTAADYGVQYIKKDGTRCEPMEQRAQRPNRRQTESKAKPSLLEYSEVRRRKAKDNRRQTESNIKLAPSYAESRQRKTKSKRKT